MRFSKDNRILFELVKVRITRVRIRQISLYYNLVGLLNFFSDNFFFSILFCYIVNNVLKFVKTANFTLLVTREVYGCNLIGIHVFF